MHHVKTRPYSSNDTAMDIVAHVKQGKPSFVENLIRITNGIVSFQFRNEFQKTDLLETNLVLDCGELDMERGITFASERISYKDRKIYVVETPGNAYL